MVNYNNSPGGEGSGCDIRGELRFYVFFESSTYVGYGKIIFLDLKWGTKKTPGGYRFFLSSKGTTLCSLKKKFFIYQNNCFSWIRLAEEMKKMVFKMIFSYLVPEISVFKGPNIGLFCTFQVTSALCQHILNDFEWVQ